MTEFHDWIQPNLINVLNNLMSMPSVIILVKAFLRYKAKRRKKQNVGWICEKLSVLRQIAIFDFHFIFGPMNHLLKVGR